MKKIILMLILTATIVFSQDIPRYIAYQGVLIDKNKQLKPDKTYSFSFKLYDSQTNGNLVWPLVPNVQTLLVTNGIFSTLIGPLDNIEFSKPFYLDITVDGEQFPQRILLYSSPYALGIANNSVSNSKIQNNAVTEDKIADNSITNKKLADGAVSSSKIQNSEVIETKLADKSVSNRTIQTNSIDSNKIIDKSVSYNDLSISSASTGNVLTYNNNTWQPQAPSGVPVGTIMAFSANVSSTFETKNRWLVCDGRFLKKNDYSELYDLIGIANTYGSNTVIGGEVYFKIPDLRGLFLRGSGTNSTRKKSNNDYFTGGNVGDYTDDQFQSHQHIFLTVDWQMANRDIPNAGTAWGEKGDKTWSVVEDLSANYGPPRNGTETKPASISIIYIIKY